MSREQGPGPVEEQPEQGKTRELLETLNSSGVDHEDLMVLTTVLRKAHEGTQIDVEQFETEYPGFKERLQRVFELMVEINDVAGQEQIGRVMKSDAEGKAKE